MLKENEHIETLGKGVKIIVSDIHHFSTDTILLSNFSNPKAKDKVIELGTGCGTIPLLITKNNQNQDITAVDIQTDACSLLQKSISLNGFDNIKVINSDFKELKGKVPFGEFNLVICNPPYKEDGTGIHNPDSGKMTARHEVACTLEDIIRVSSSLLNFGGRLCMCLRPERLTDMLSLMRNYHLEPKRLRFVQQRQKKEPKLFLIEGRKGGKPGFMKVLPVLMIEDEKGNFSQEMLDIYGDYKEQPSTQNILETKCN